MTASRLTFILLTVTCLVLLPTIASAYDVGVAPATRKILPATPMPEEQSIAIKGARNEWVDFQIVVRDAGGVEDIDVKLSDLAGPNGASIPAANADLFREHYIYIDNESPSSVSVHVREIGWYPDPLIPFNDPYSDEAEPVGAPFTITGEETGTVFVDWHIPIDAAPGEYTATATVKAKGQDDVTLAITLTVWEFEIPKERTIATAFNFSFDRPRNYHGGPEDQESGNYPTILDNYYFTLHEHRMDPTHVKGHVVFTFDENDKLEPIDWTEYDGYVGKFVDGTYYPDGVGVNRFSVDYFRPGKGLYGMTESGYKQAAKAFAEHLDEKGWWEHAYVYSTDEPWLNGGDEEFLQIKEDGERLLAASELWKGHILVTSPYNDIIKDVIGIWCPVTPMYDDWWWLDGSYGGWDTYTECLERDQELWFYVCNANVPPYAGYDIDTAIGYEPRIVKWGTWFERSTGFLYWRVNYWIDYDPWHIYQNLEHFGEMFSRNGDGLLIYPGDHNGDHEGKGSPEWLSIDGPIVSYRMKQIRDGLEDWEMFRLAESLGAEDFVREQVRTAYTKFGTFILEDCEKPELYCPEREPWTIDEYVMLEAREQIALKIQYLLYPDRYEDPEAEDLPGGGDTDSPAETEESARKKGDDGGCRSAATNAAWLGLMLLAFGFVTRRIYRRQG